MGRRGAARIAPCLRLPVLCWSRRVFIHHSPHGVLGRAVLYGRLHRALPVHHPVSHFSPRQPVLHSPHHNRLVLRYGNIMGGDAIAENYRFGVARPQDRQLG